MKRLALVYLSCFLTFLTIDAIWLGYVAGSFYRSRLNGIISDDVRLVPALLFYALFVFALTILIVYPSLDRSTTVLLGRAFLFGAVCYATYELTNYSTIAEWPLSVVVVDILWGGFLSTAVSGVGRYVASLL